MVNVACRACWIKFGADIILAIRSVDFFTFTVEKFVCKSFPISKVP